MLTNAATVVAMVLVVNASTAVSFLLLVRMCYPTALHLVLLRESLTLFILLRVSQTSIPPLLRSWLQIPLDDLKVLHEALKGMFLCV